MKTFTFQCFLGILLLSLPHLLPKPGQLNSTRRRENTMPPCLPGNPELKQQWRSRSVNRTGGSEYGGAQRADEQVWIAGEESMKWEAAIWTAFVRLMREMMKVKTGAFDFLNRSLRCNAKIQIIENNNNTTFRETLCTANQETLCCVLVWRRSIC